MSFVAVGITTAAIGAGTSIAGGILNFRAARKEAKKARRQNKRAKQEYQQQLEAYKNLDTSNPYLNMENVMEDLTINQQQAEFTRQQFAQSQANILSGLREAAGTSGIAALAQSLARQGQLASQQASVSIGQQEATNQRSERIMASQLQQLEKRGEIYSRGLEQRRTETLLGMAQQRRAAALNRQAQAQQAKTAAIGGAIQGVGQAAIAGVQLGALSKLGQGGNVGGVTDPSISQGLRNISLGDLGQSRTTLNLPQITPLNIALDRTIYSSGGDNTNNPLGLSGFDLAFYNARVAQGGGDYSKGAGGTFMYNQNEYTTNLDREVAPGTFGPPLKQ
jgi:hypothetical protein